MHRTQSYIGAYNIYIYIYIYIYIVSPGPVLLAISRLVGNTKEYILLLSGQYNRTLQNLLRVKLLKKSVKRSVFNVSIPTRAICPMHVITPKGTQMAVYRENGVPYW